MVCRREVRMKMVVREVRVKMVVVRNDKKRGSIM